MNKYKNIKTDELIKYYNSFIENRDPEYNMLCKFVENYKNNKFRDADDICNVIKNYNDDIKAELLELFDVKIDRLVIKEKFLQASYYKNMRNYFFKRIN